MLAHAIDVRTARESGHGHIRQTNSDFASAFSTAVTDPTDTGIDIRQKLEAVQ